MILDKCCSWHNNGIQEYIVKFACYFESTVRRYGTTNVNGKKIIFHFGIVYLFLPIGCISPAGCSVHSMRSPISFPFLFPFSQYFPLSLSIHLFFSFSLPPFIQQSSFLDRIDHNSANGTFPCISKAINMRAKEKSENGEGQKVAKERIG